ncbi:Apc13p-domain-containing protein [Amniculicola lignicola CBS 123094]|uniref:Apc13p-domain-containing protein n=1 Tax=Amniculicola lignicola CBS 123094 TaxID=1392246 RepID=A0A6A5VXR2_9PLEO|nr:Apc13p-domain-containing protein [Amniculicola lignicola CBS 123094]
MTTRDSSASYLHLHYAHHSDHLETFTNPTSSHLSPEDIYIPPHHQPLNPEDEDDVVPDQHAAFGIQRATQTKRETLWKDLGLEELVSRGPGEGVGGVKAGGRGGGGSAIAAGGVGALRRDEPVRLALRRRPGVGAGGMGEAVGERGMGSMAGNGLPR